MFENTYFPKARRYWYMGSFYDWPKAQIHPMSHALHYGTSVFEGIRAYSTPKGPAVFRLTEHMNRFFHSASVVRMESPFSKEEIIHAIKAVMKENELDSAYIRPLLFRSYGNLGLLPKHSPVKLLIGAWQWEAYLGEKAKEGVHAYILPWKRIHHSQFDMTAKVGGLYVLSSICGNIAREKGCDEGIFLNLEGNIAEGPGENIFVVTNGIIKTNDTSESILEGITRTSILEIAGDLGMKTSVGPISKEEFFRADEAFFTGTAVEVAPIVRVADGSESKNSKKEYTIGSGRAGRITTQIIDNYKQIVGGKNKAYEKWLTYVYD